MEGTMKERFPDVLVEKVSYKGFIHCDNPVRPPNKMTIEGVHSMFQSKKKMKAAQSDNPLACRGFKKAVIMTVTKEGFRLDMLSSDQEGSLLHALTSKILYATCIEKHIYVVTKRSTKPGRYACHCIKGEVKDKDEPKITRIARFIHETALEQNTAKPGGGGGGAGMATGTAGASGGQGRRKMSLINDDAAAADMRAAVLGSMEGEDADTQSVMTDGYIDDVQGGSREPSVQMRMRGKSSRLQEYLGPVRNSLNEDDLNALSISDFSQLNMETGDEPKPLSSKDKILEAMMWYHGSISRDVADQLLLGKPAGTYIVRFSSTKGGYCISLMNQQNAVQHFATVSADGKLSLHGHKNRYNSMIDLVDHYTRHDITSQGDRCKFPCSGKA